MANEKKDIQNSDTRAPQIGIKFNKVHRFLKYRWFSLGMSMVIIIIGLIMYIQKGGFDLGIDFLGGARVEAQINLEDIEVSTIRKLFDIQGIDSEVTTIGSAEEKNYLITIAGEEGGSIEEIEQITQKLYDTYGEENVDIRGSEVIGAKIGESFAERSIQLILVVSALILLYVAIRFDFAYGTGAIMALFHDILIMLAFTVFFNIRVDITVIAAILTIIGYSINDSIVIFDRVRENHDLNKEEDYELVMDKSITQSLSRTIVTSITTLFVAVAIYVWGGRVLKDFGLILIIGIISGTYSSIFVATPVTFMLKGRLDKETHIAAWDEKKEEKEKQKKIKSKK